MVQPLWETVWRFLRKLKIELPYDPAILLLGIYPKKPKTLIQKDTCGGLQDGRVKHGDHLPPHKYIYMWNSSYRTPTEHWQKTSDFPKGKKIPTYLGEAKEKRKNRDKRIGTGPAPLGGSCEGGKVPTH